jgi:DNA-binding transcriptional regulator YbjK
VTTTFRRLDNQLGGGYGRSSITAYLTGWMAYDLDQHPAALRYLIQALCLAVASTDQALGAEILAGMSHQAAYLGHNQDAVDMTRAAG